MRKLLLWIAAFVSCLNWAQELPPVQHFSPEAYGADNQNWMISQDGQGRVYAANNKGLLQYNGTSWSFYPTPNETIIRSVMVDSSRIYVGFYMGFGYWTRDRMGVLHYRALSEELGVEMIDDEQFWNIFTYGKYILFQSLDRIYIWDEPADTVSIIEAEGTIVKLFQVEENFYFQVMDQGLYTISNGQKELVSDDPIMRSRRMAGAFRQDGKMIFLSEQAGFFEVPGNNVVPWVTDFDSQLANIEVYSFVESRSGHLVLGTISNGVYLLDPKGRLTYQIDRSGGLMNNTALSLFEDVDGNIWAGLDNGIACVNINAPIRNYIDSSGSLGTTYETAVLDGMLYLGTNQGLFYRPLNSTEAFEFIEGTGGQVWKLRIINNTLFCGHDSGTFIVKDQIAQQIAAVPGTWDIKQIPGRSNDLLLQGNYSGLYILERKDEGWVIRNKLSGFDISSKDFEFASQDKLILSHEYKGVYKLQLERNLERVLNYGRMTSVEKGTHASLARYMDKIYYANKNGVYRFDPSLDDFKPEPELSELINAKNYVTGTLIADSFDRLWLFAKNFVFAVSQDRLGQGFQIDRLSIPQDLRKEMVGHESVFSLDESQTIMGIANGYMRLALNETVSIATDARIDRIVFASLNGERRDVKLDTTGILPHNLNNLVLSYSISNYQKYSRTQFQHRLLGWQEDWSAWSEESEVSYDNLPPGDYEFQLRTKINDRISTSVTENYQFEIEDPWYTRVEAKVMYVVFGVLVLIGINLMYRQYYRKQRRRLLDEELKEAKLRQLADKQEIMELRNDKLKNEIESRNRELAVSTMNMINKNNVLNKIKSELVKVSDMEELQPVIQHIDNTLNAEDDWKLFEEAFNYADTDFFKKLKQKHPGLTPNDLRLCVYLRLNLSSKEIAPLLNISPRSVEIKRYRLRKKLELDSSINLNEYFIGL